MIFRVRHHNPPLGSWSVGHQQVSKSKQRNGNGKAVRETAELDYTLTHYSIGIAGLEISEVENLR
jgi:hypothetical protein